MHDKIDVVADIMRDIMIETEEDLRTIPVLGLVRDTPLSKINKNIGMVRDVAIKDTVKLLDDIGEALGISTESLQEDATKNIKSLSGEFRLRSSDSMRKDLFKATQQGINKQPKIVTKSGRKWGYKEYMEMNIRTTLAHELKDMQLKVGGDAGVVFYLCNVFQDSANDHAPFQGKYYYDQRYKTFGYDEDTLTHINKSIRDKKIMPLQYVQENKPYLGTRPNCRHTFTPVSIEQVTNVAPLKLSKEIGTTTGKYTNQKYKATQALRNVELTLRNYDYKYKMNRELAKTTKDPELKEKFTKQARHNRMLTRKWGKRRDVIVEKNPFLRKDTRRENRDIILNDLGVKYNTPNRKDLQNVFNAIEYNKVTLTALEFEKWLKSESKRLEFDFFTLL